FVGTLQICTPMFDVSTVLHTYGLFGVFVEITVIELGNTYFQRDAVANPCPIIAITTGCLIEGGATFMGRAFEKHVGEYVDDSWTCNLITCAFSGLVCALDTNWYYECQLIRLWITISSGSPTIIERAQQQTFSPSFQLVVYRSLKAVATLAKERRRCEHFSGGKAL
ncbi:hypothetical protein TELCIR_18688, partial [Teladorsagia circumcincta]